MLAMVGDRPSCSDRVAVASVMVRLRSCRRRGARMSPVLVPEGRVVSPIRVVVVTVAVMVFLPHLVRVDSAGWSSYPGKRKWATLDGHDTRSYTHRGAHVLSTTTTPTRGRLPAIPTIPWIAPDRKYARRLR